MPVSLKTPLPAGAATAPMSESCMVVAPLPARGAGAGSGDGSTIPAALAGAVSGFPPERRGSALGIWGASAGMSNLLGPLLLGHLFDVIDVDGPEGIASVLAIANTLDEVGQASLDVHQNAHQGKVGVLALSPEPGLGVTNPELRARFESQINRFRGA